MTTFIHSFLNKQHPLPFEARRPEYMFYGPFIGADFLRVLLLEVLNENNIYTRDAENIGEMATEYIENLKNKFQKNSTEIMSILAAEVLDILDQNTRWSEVRQEVKAYFYP